MVEIVERLLTIRRQLGLFGLIPLYGLMLLDNAGWCGGAGLDLLRNVNSVSFFPNPIYIGRSTGDVLQHLNNEVFAGGLVVSNARPLSYQVIVYTPLRAWYSQKWNTPHSEERLAELDALFRDGQVVGDWCCRKMIAIVERQKDREATVKLVALGYQLAYENADYDILLRLPLRSAGP